MLFQGGGRREFAKSLGIRGQNNWEPKLAEETWLAEPTLNVSIKYIIVYTFWPVKSQTARLYNQVSH